MQTNLLYHLWINFFSNWQVYPLIALVKLKKHLLCQVQRKRTNTFRNPKHLLLIWLSRCKIQMVSVQESFSSLIKKNSCFPFIHFSFLIFYISCKYVVLIIVFFFFFFFFFFFVLLNKPDFKKMNTHYWLKYNKNIFLNEINGSIEWQNQTNFFFISNIDQIQTSMYRASQNRCNRLIW